jgi:competence protein ComEC
MHLLSRLLFFCLGLVAASPLWASEKDGRLDIYWVDSEGGGSTLIVTPANESVLIDTGNPGGRDAKRIVDVARAAGLTRIDYVVLTHFHRDHFGGGAEIAQELPVGTIFERELPKGDPDGNAVSTFPVQIKPWTEIAAKRVRLAPGVVIPLKSSAGPVADGSPTDGTKGAGRSARPLPLQLRCLAADQHFVQPASDAPSNAKPLAADNTEKTIKPSDNDNSAVFLLSFGAFRFFDGGDLTWNFEAKLVSPVNLVGPVDVYQTNHHGLDVSNNPLLVRALDPHVVVMNNGARKGGQPGTFATIKSLPHLQAWYQMHRSFNVPEEENAKPEYIANLAEPLPPESCTAHIIKLSVAPDGQSYTVELPANHHARTYKTRL